MIIPLHKYRSKDWKLLTIAPTVPYFSSRTAAQSKPNLCGRGSNRTHLEEQPTMVFNRQHQKLAAAADPRDQKPMICDLCKLQEASAPWPVSARFAVRAYER